MTSGKLALTIPDKPSSPKQRYIAVRPELNLMNKLHLQDMPFFRDGLDYKKANAGAQSLVIEQNFQAAIC